MFRYLKDGIKFLGQEGVRRSPARSEIITKN